MTSSLWDAFWFTVPFYDNPPVTDGSGDTVLWSFNFGFVVSLIEEVIEEFIKLPMIWDAMMLMCCCCNCTMPIRSGTQKPKRTPDSKVHVANMGPTWVLSAPDGPHAGPMNLATSVIQQWNNDANCMLSCAWSPFRSIRHRHGRSWWWWRHGCKYLCCDQNAVIQVDGYHVSHWSKLWHVAKNGGYYIWQTTFLNAFSSTKILNFD